MNKVNNKPVIFANIFLIAILNLLWYFKSFKLANYYYLFPNWLFFESFVHNFWLTRFPSFRAINCHLKHFHIAFWQKRKFLISLCQIMSGKLKIPQKQSLCHICVRSTADEHELHFMRDESSTMQKEQQIKIKLKSPPTLGRKIWQNMNCTSHNKQ